MAVAAEVTCTLTELQKFSVQEGPIISAAPQPLTLHAILLVPKIYEITLLRGCQVVFKREKQHNGVTGKRSRLQLFRTFYKGRVDAPFKLTILDGSAWTNERTAQAQVCNA